MTKLPFLLYLIFLLTAPFPDIQAQNIWYVSEGSPTENGCSSWEDACPDLQQALARSAPGDQIWVRAGIYRPDPGLDRYRSFHLKNGVSIFGGFDGTEKSLTERAGQFRETILSGDLARNDQPDSPPAGKHLPRFLHHEDNSLHILRADGTDATALLDGVTIRGGYADGEGLDEQGAGLLFLGGSPVLRNCVIEWNFAAFQGGGAQLKEGSNPRFESCTFQYNYAGDNGGAVYNGQSSPTFQDCLFRGNVGTRYAGAVCNRDNSNALFSNCVFEDNSAALQPVMNDGGGGGAMVNAESHPVLTDCRFTRNRATFGRGGAMVNESNQQLGAGSSPTLLRCTFQENVARNGGALYSQDRSQSWIENCLFEKNEATDVDHGAGVFYSQDSSPTLVNSTFLDNVVGCIYFTSQGTQRPLISHCYFEGNLGGHALIYALAEAHPKVEDCTFTNNISYVCVFATEDATATVESCVMTHNIMDTVGGVHVTNGGTIRNCLVADNETLTEFSVGGIIAGDREGDSQKVLVENCVVVRNKVPDGLGISGGIMIRGGTVRNCTVTENSGGTLTDGLLAWGSEVSLENSILRAKQGSLLLEYVPGNLLVSFSNVQGGVPEINDYGGNIDLDPLFAEDGYHLLMTSPCVDAGNPDFVPPREDRDIDGQARMTGRAVDMGADELGTRPRLPKGEVR